MSDRDNPMMVVQVPERQEAQRRRQRGIRANAAGPAPGKRHLGLHYPPERVRNIRTVAAFTNEFLPAEWIWEHIEGPLAEDLQEMGRLLARGVTSGARPEESAARRRSAVPVETKQLGVLYPQERLQQLRTVASFQGISVSEWIWRNIEEPLSDALVNVWQTLRREVGNGSGGRSGRGNGA